MIIPLTLTLSPAYRQAGTRGEGDKGGENKVYDAG